MKRQVLENRFTAFIAGCVVAIVVGACATNNPPPPETVQQAPPGTVQQAPPGTVQQAPPGTVQQAPPGPGAVLEEAVVRARRSGSGGVQPSMTAGADVAANVSASGAIPQSLQLEMSGDPDILLGALSPGEDLWIIATPGQAAAASAAAASAAANPIDALYDDSQPGTGAMIATYVPAALPGSPEQRDVPLPLQHTDVRAQITGYVGSVDVTQQFVNPFNVKIEAAYVFPLPEKAAVSEFVMTIGERRIRGILREREQAEAIYRQAREQGYRASLLTQHRPNVFEQKVANIEPGRAIDVNIRYFHTLAYRDGWYSFVFPTVVGPRYNPPGYPDPVRAQPRTYPAPVSGGATVGYLRPGERSGHDIGIAVELDAGVAIEAIKSSHTIDETRTGASTARIELASQTTIPNRDFVLDFKVAGGQVKTNLLTHADPDQPGQGYFTMMLYPPEDLERLRRRPMEMVFVLDCSGSMDGRPIEQAKAAILEAFDMLEPQDTFQVIRFSNNASQFGRDPVRATDRNIARAKRYVRSLQGSGGTRMIEGIRAALNFPHDRRRLRFVTFLTDGYIGNEAEILAEIHRSIGESRIFSFGVGSSVNRYLMERMAGAGRGAVAYLGLQDSGSEVMADFFNRVSHPALSDIEIEWGGMRVANVYPSRLPDLFVGRPIVMTGRYFGAPGAPIVRGLAGEKGVEFVLPHDAGNRRHAFLPKIWARLRIADFADRQTRGDAYGDLARAIRSTALKYGLMSDYTAFVAVDATQPTAGDYGVTVPQAVPVPEGVRYRTTVGN